MESVTTFTGALRDALDQARDQALDQLTAAWQLHVARVEEQLRSGWEENISRLLEERFAELSERFSGEVETAVQERLRGEVERLRGQDRRETARRLSEHLNTGARRIRQAGKQEEWSGALVDAAAGLSRRAAVFTVQGEALRLERSSFDAPPVEIPFGRAPALAEAVRSREPVVAAATPGEISPELVDAGGPECGPRVFLFPIFGAGKTVALLYAEGSADVVNVDALELLSSLASAVWEARAQAATAATLAATAGGAQKATSPEPAGASSAANGLVAIQAAVEPVRPSWSDLPANEQDLHLKAQRFARVQVAEIRLFKSSAVKQGRADRTLYTLLREDVDRNRQVYAQQHLRACPSMVDYLHLELVRTLANDNPELLGVDYPGPLV
ncbi:MAG: hypothetical protein R2762_05240 [Bryobacteraceae bacterium]